MKTDSQNIHLEQYLFDLCLNNTPSASPADGNALLELAKRHRLLSLVNRYISSTASIPVVVKLKSEELAMQKVRHSMVLTQQLIRLAKIFQDSNIEWLTLKGPALAQYLFQDIGKRQSNDLDIMVKPQNLHQTDAILRSLGFQDQSSLPFQNMNPNEQKAFIQISHELPYFHTELGIKVELHWKLVAPQSLFPKTDEEIWRNKSSILLANQSIPILGNEDILLYLCLHGAKHQWFRLFWLRDIHLLLQKKELDLDALLYKLRHAGNHRALLSALHLCAYFFRFDLSDLMRKMSVEDTVFQKLLEKYKEAIFLPEECSAPTNGGNLLAITKNVMLLKKGLKFKLECLYRFRTSPKDWEKLKLSNRWFFIYYILRPFLMVGRAS